MATAKLHDGRAIVAYVDGKAVDSNGVEIEGAPKQPKDTDPSEQPHAMAGLNTEERSAAILAGAFASALKDGGKTAKVQAVGSGQAEKIGTGTSGSTDVDELPTIKDLPDHVAGLKTVAEVRAMARRDDRVSAEPIYKARLAELKEEK
jgi:hypothetical protein